MTDANHCAYPADSQTHTEGGLTKREYFAAMAMSGNQGYEYKGGEDPKDVAKRAVEIADALIAELNK